MASAIRKEKKTDYSNNKKQSTSAEKLKIILFKTAQRNLRTLKGPSALINNSWAQYKTGCLV